jgi:hypothetical protein
MSVPPYGVAIHGAIASGDVRQMQQVAGEAEEWLRSAGDVRAALEVLRGEIAKLESRNS